MALIATVLSKSVWGQSVSREDKDITQLYNNIEMDSDDDQQKKVN